MKIRLWLCLALCLAGCAAPAPVQPAQTTAMATQTVSATLSPTTTLTSHPTQETPTPARPGRMVDARSAQIFSNPNEATGLEVSDGMLWVASSGGVVSWDLARARAQLFTTREGLAQIDANDVVVCDIPERRVVVGHDTGALSLFDPETRRWSQLPLVFEGGALPNARALYCDDRGRRLIVGSTGGLATLDVDSNTWRLVTARDGFVAKDVLDLGVNGSEIWAAAGEQGAYLVVGNSVFPVNGDSGYPSGAIYAVEARDGLVWMGAASGLVRVENRRWTSYGAETAKGLPFSVVNNLTVSPDGTVWISNREEGVCAFDPVLLNCSVIYPALSDTTVSDVVLDDDGAAYAGTLGRGVLRLDRFGVRQFALKQDQLIGNFVTGFAEDALGRLWVSSNRGVNWLDPSQPDLAWQSVREGKDGLLYSATNGVFTANRQVWVTYENQPAVSYWDGAAWQSLTEGIPGPVRWVTSDDHQRVWLATSDGVVMIDGERNLLFTEENVLPSSDARVVMVDGEKVWIGTAGGLVSFQNGHWQDELLGLAVNAIVRGAEGLLLGTDRGIIRFEDDIPLLWPVVLLTQMHPDFEVISLAVGPAAGELWAGTADRGLYHFDGRAWQHLEVSGGMPADWARAILVDQMGAVWVAAVTAGRGGAVMRFTP